MKEMDIKVKLHRKGNKYKGTIIIKNKHLVSNNKHLVVLFREVMGEIGKQFNINIDVIVEREK